MPLFYCDRSAMAASVYQENFNLINQPTTYCMIPFLTVAKNKVSLHSGSSNVHFLSVVSPSLLLASQTIMFQIIIIHFRNSIVLFWIFRWKYFMSYVAQSYNWRQNRNENISTCMVVRWIIEFISCTIYHLVCCIF